MKNCVNRQTNIWPLGFEALRHLSRKFTGYLLFQKSVVKFRQAVQTADSRDAFFPLTLISLSRWESIRTRLCGLVRSVSRSALAVAHLFLPINLAERT